MISGLLCQIRRTEVDIVRSRKKDKLLWSRLFFSGLQFCDDHSESKSHLLSKCGRSHGFSFCMCVSFIEALAIGMLNYLG